MLEPAAERCKTMVAEAASLAVKETIATETAKEVAEQQLLSHLRASAEARRTSQFFRLLQAEVSAGVQSADVMSAAGRKALLRCRKALQD